MPTEYTSGCRLPANEAGRRQRGAAMLLALGFLTIFLLISVGFAYTSIMSNKRAVASSDAVKAKLLAESALDRVRTGIERVADEDDDGDGQLDSGEDRDGDGVLDRGFYPGNLFYRPSDISDPWYGRSYYLSGSSDSVDIENAMSHYLTTGDGRRLAFTPSTSPVPGGAGWLPVSAETGDDGTTKLLGRLSYVAVDTSGMANPFSAHLDLSAMGFSQTFASKLRDQNWHSLQHMVGATNPDDQQWKRMKRTLAAHDVTTDTYWRDVNDSGDWDQGEIRSRMNLTGMGSDFAAVSNLYELFIGDPTVEADDAAWIKETEHNVWAMRGEDLDGDGELDSGEDFDNDGELDASWQAKSGLSSLQVKRRIAAQIAVNMVDYADADSLPTPAHIDDAGNIQAGTDDNYYSVYGTEQTWGVSEIAVRVKADVITEEATHYTLDGDIGLNPTNSAMSEFECHTPYGVINRDVLMDHGATFDYDYKAYKVVIKPKGNGRTVTIAGQEVKLDTNTTYTIESSSWFDVNLRNTNPGASKWNQALGHWWIDIEADDVTITPDPDISVVKHKLEVTPAFRGEIFYPFATGMSQDCTLSLSYMVHVVTENGPEGTQEAEISIPLDSQVDVGGGTLAFSSWYKSGKTMPMSKAFDYDAGNDSYRVADVKLRALVLKDSDGNPIDNVPVAAAGEQSLYLCSWEQSASTTTDSTLYATARAHDALDNGRGEIDAAFNDYWTLLPGDEYLSTTDQDAGIGDITGTTSYRDGEMAKIEVKNKPFTSLAELGRVHSFQAARSLRLWAPSAKYERGSAAEILSLFKTSEDLDGDGELDAGEDVDGDGKLDTKNTIDEDVNRNGELEPYEDLDGDGRLDRAEQASRININTLQRPVLKALFSKSTVDAGTAADAVLNARSNGVTFTNIGEVFNQVAAVTGGTSADDKVQENIVGLLAENLTVRSNTYVVVITAQAIKDVAGLSYEDGTKTAAYNRLDYDSITGEYIDRILAEQKIYAVLYRDALTGETRVLRYHTVH